MPRLILLIILCLLLGCNTDLKSQGQSCRIKHENKRSEYVFDRYNTYIDAYRDRPLAEVLIHTAKFFLGKPYVASTLENEGAERLIVNFDEFDCTTFVETCVALTLTTKSANPGYEKYLEKLQTIRYKKGIIDGYSSRLHYMTSWIKDNCEKGIFENISEKLGGIQFNKKIDFMSTHPNLYMKLKNNSAEIEKIVIEETNIDKYRYIVIPKNDIFKRENTFQTGDIIIFATATDGLDYSHIGIAYWDREILKMIHASSRAKKVVIENHTINDYCQLSRNCTGITILRLGEREINIEK